jgi:hypothetical protein
MLVGWRCVPKLLVYTKSEYSRSITIRTNIIGKLDAGRHTAWNTCYTVSGTVMAWGHAANTMASGNRLALYDYVVNVDRGSDCSDLQ